MTLLYSQDITDLEILEASLKIMETQGWLQRRFRTDTGACCPTGSAKYVAEELLNPPNPSVLTLAEREIADRLATLLAPALRKQFKERVKKHYLSSAPPSDRHTVILFNDDDETTFADVTAVYQAKMEELKAADGA